MGLFLQDAVQEVDILAEAVPPEGRQLTGGQRFFACEFLADGDISRITELADLHAEVSVRGAGELSEGGERKGLPDQGADNHQAQLRLEHLRDIIHLHERNLSASQCNKCP